MALCREHHTEQHAIGIFTFIERYPQVELHLLMLGWEINHTYRKLFRPKN